MSEATNIYSNLSNQTKFRLNEINKMKDYFNANIQERKTMSTKPSKYIAAFDYFDKTLIALSATSGGISIISFASIIGAPVKIASASFSLMYFFIKGVIKKILKIKRNKSKKHHEIAMLAKKNWMPLKNWYLKH